MHPTSATANHPLGDHIAVRLASACSLPVRRVRGDDSNPLPGLIDGGAARADPEVVRSRIVELPGNPGVPEQRADDALGPRVRNDHNLRCTPSRADFNDDDKPVTDS